ncbi:hypothetical protein CYMTET_35936 [Cymbomonas tetramitiformis]|uniref:F5/8 type C domain-containing protein n=1 Tax=Cymbomonas tetramitiformis TaxID=36881 RepID=A0AAE0F877_9CHLO|nr:hypothetical protein CYMTET_35936 [Cymbomonas tetramitiformis]
MSLMVNADGSSSDGTVMIPATSFSTQFVTPATTYLKVMGLESGTTCSVSTGLTLFLIGSELNRVYSARAPNLETGTTLSCSAPVMVISETSQREMNLITTAYGRCALEALGMQSGVIQDSQLSASSAWGNDACDVTNGRLLSSGSNHAWCSQTTNVGEWMQVDLGHIRSIRAIATQGRDWDQEAQWVSAYNVSSSVDGITWAAVMNQDGIGTFAGNVDEHTVVTQYFSSFVQARYIRVYPQTYQDWMSMRMELYRCEGDTATWYTEYSGSTCTGTRYTYDPANGCDGWAGVTAEECKNYCTSNAQANNCPQRTCAAAAHFPESGLCHLYESCTATYSSDDQNLYTKNTDLTPFAAISSIGDRLAPVTNFKFAVPSDRFDVLGPRSAFPV